MSSVSKRGNTYQIRVFNGYDSTGHQIVKSMTWRPPINWTEAKAKKEAQKQAALFEEKIKSNGVIDSNIPFSEFAEKWMK